MSRPDEDDDDGDIHDPRDHFRAIVEAAPLPLLVSRVTDGRVLYGNAALAELVRLPVETLVGRASPDFYVDRADRDGVLAEVRARGRVRGREVQIQRADGERRWVMLSVEPLVFDGEPALVTAITDVTARREAEEALRVSEARLRHTAFHDALTALPNRAMFGDLLARELARAQRNPAYRFAVLFLDLDGFKHVNDSLGHEAGDELLVTIAARLRTCLRTGDVAARLGGDEFTVLLADVREPAQATSAAERILAAVGQPVTIRGQSVVPGASVGVVLSGAEHEHPDRILGDADAAMYRAKASGKGRYVVFEPSMRSGG